MPEKLTNESHGIFFVLLLFISNWSNNCTKKVSGRFLILLIIGVWFVRQFTFSFVCKFYWYKLNKYN